MPNSQRGVRISEGLRRSAAARACPECGRHAALVHRDVAGIRYTDGTVEITQSAVACRWAPDRCGWPGELVDHTPR